ncbi:hypothetical protein GF354_04275 [Candidatus Peregrinibacteria bacterium]|nr:hypothetical protein [Candidatus Peregrinibacteria bacterium]
MKIKKLNFAAVLILIILSALIFFLSPTSKSPKLEGTNDEPTYKAKITDIAELGSQKNIALTILNGDKEGEQVVTVEDEQFVLNQRNFKIGDKVLIVYLDNSGSYYIYDFVRSNSLLLLFVIFLAAVVVVSGLGGVGAIIGMAFSFLVLFKLTLPFILSGISPVLAAVLSGFLIIPVTFFLSHGLNKKTLIAMAGTVITLILVYILAYAFIHFGNLTGLSSEEGSFLRPEVIERIDFRGLVLAGMIIGIIGVLDDITISQAAIVQQLKETKKNIKFKELYFRSMKVGKDHISSMVNTLILIYAGAALPLLLLFVDYQNSFNEIINIEMISEEIIRTLIGSLGLILAVPVTTAIAAFDFSKSN